MTGTHDAGQHVMTVGEIREAVRQLDAERSARGIAPGADAWHKTARNLRELFWEVIRQRDHAESERDEARAEVARLSQALRAWQERHDDALLKIADLRGTVDASEADVKRLEAALHDAEANGGWATVLRLTEDERPWERRR